MTIAIGTDYWLYARAFICNTTNISSEEMPHKDKKDPGGLTHSGLWRICCLEGLKRGVCVKINHFPEDTDYDHDSAEYLLRVVRASSIFPSSAPSCCCWGGSAWPPAGSTSPSATSSWALGSYSSLLASATSSG
ncbi:unnamed protein product [Natator depressus]